MSGPKTDATGKIQKKPNGKKLAAWLADSNAIAEIGRALPRHISPDRMARILVTALRTTPKLDQCTPVSFMGNVMQLAQLGLEPNTPLGHAWLIPRWSSKRKVMECTSIIGYQGYIDLARRSGMVSTVYAFVVREGDTFEYELGLHPNIRHVPSGSPDRESQKITHAYAVANLNDGEPQFVVLSRAQIDARMMRSETYGKSFSPWKSDFEAMAQKSAVRALWKFLPKSSEIAQADALETGREQELPATQYVDPEIMHSLESHGWSQPEEAAQEEAQAEESAPEPEPSTEAPPAGEPAGPDEEAERLLGLVREATSAKEVNAIYDANKAAIEALPGDLQKEIVDACGKRAEELGGEG